MKHYYLLANMFYYPNLELINTFNDCMRELVLKYPESKQTLKDFERHLTTKTLGEQQEYYSKTFDVKALCCLDLGYVIFGEDYKRGEFLVNMKMEQKTAGQNCDVELADYLPNVLKLFYYHKNKEFVEELAYCITIPALKEILNEFRSDRNIYKKLLETVLLILEKDFGHCDMQQINITKEKDNKVINRTFKV